MPRHDREPGPRDHRDVAYEMAENLRDFAGQLQGMKGEAANWLKADEYRALRHRLENLHAAAEAAMVEARRRVRLNEGASAVAPGRPPRLCAPSPSGPRRSR